MPCSSNVVETYNSLSSAVFIVCGAVGLVLSALRALMRHFITPRRCLSSSARDLSLPCPGLARENCWTSCLCRYWPLAMSGSLMVFTGFHATAVARYILCRQRCWRRYRLRRIPRTRATCGSSVSLLHGAGGGSSIPCGCSLSLRLTDILVVELPSLDDAARQGLLKFEGRFGEVAHVRTNAAVLSSFHLALRRAADLLLATATRGIRGEQSAASSNST